MAQTERSYSIFRFKGPLHDSEAQQIMWNQVGEEREITLYDTDVNGELVRAVINPHLLIEEDKSGELFTTALEHLKKQKSLKSQSLTLFRIFMEAKSLESLKTRMKSNWE